MDDERDPTLPPHRVYRDLRVVADTLEHPENLTIGVIVDGAFVPIAQHNFGAVEQMKTRWNDLGGVHVEGGDTAALAEHENRLAELERKHLALEAQVKQLAPKKPPAAKS
jgi:hypothetical protein